ncbi:uncharacterized protein LOC132726824 [Ruditapes philippinarum]|uniref:uncharacterized protein LOC132726824 n=1 Tax=Ruditapes philippinarum TaxID=129788 RepID=UPI00295B6A9F|nr:uncharacterized protein LOC132726824 [Ruditapes philippinarum]
MRKTALRDKSMIQFPVQRFNIILRYMIKNNLIQSHLSPVADSLSQLLIEENGYHTENFGSFICKMVPYKSKQTGYAKNPDHEKENEKDTLKASLTIFEIPHDTDIVTQMTNSKSVDLLFARTEQMTAGHLKLSPCEPKLWRGQTVSSIGGRIFLQTNDTCHDSDSTLFPPGLFQLNIDMHFVLASDVP